MIRRAGGHARRAAAVACVLLTGSVHAEAVEGGAVPPPAQGQRIAVDAVAAVIERRVVTVSEVIAEARLALLERGGPALAQQPIDAGLRAAVLDTIVAQELLAWQARRAGVLVREAEIDKALEALLARFPDAAAARRFFADLGLDEDLLRGRARRDLAVEVLLKRAWASVLVTDADVERHRAQHPEGADTAAARGALERAARQRVVGDLLARARAAVDVRVMPASMEGMAP